MPKYYFANYLYLPSSETRLHYWYSMLLTAERLELLFRVAKLTAAGFGGLCAGSMCFTHFVGEPAWRSLGIWPKRDAPVKQQQERVDDTRTRPIELPPDTAVDSSSSSSCNGLHAFRAFLPFASRYTLHLQTFAVLAGLVAIALSARSGSRRVERSERLALVAGTALLAAAQLYSMLCMWRTYVELLDPSLCSGDKRTRVLYRRWSRQHKPIVVLTAYGFFALLSSLWGNFISFFEIVGVRRSPTQALTSLEARVTSYRRKHTEK